MRQIPETPVAVKGVRRKSPEKAAKMTRAVRQIPEKLVAFKGAHRNSREEAARRARAVRRIPKTPMLLEGVRRNSPEKAARRARAVRRIPETPMLLEGVRRKGPGQRAGTQMEYAKRVGNFVRTTAAGMFAWNVAARASASTSAERQRVKNVAGPASACTSV